MDPDINGSFPAEYVRQLQDRLNEAQELLAAIRSGRVDALLINGPDGDKVFTLAGAEHPYRMMIERMNEGALTLTEDGVVIFCNHRFSELLHRPIHKVVGKFFVTVVHPDDVGEFRQFLRGARNGKMHMECRLDGTGGNTIPVLISASPFEIEGHQNLCLTVTSVADLLAARSESERLKEFNLELEQKVVERTALLESQARRLRLLALQLTDAEHRERKRLAELIHDHLQQLLVAAKMRVDRLGREQTDPSASTSVVEVQRLIQESVNCARSLTTELRPPVLYEDGLVAAIQWLGQHTKTQYEVEVATCLDPRAEPSDEDVKAFLYQAVRELVFNAVKHAYINEIRVMAEAGDGNKIRLIVEDDGAGCDLAALRFKQSKNEGLGLFSIQERIAALGGTMEIVSQPGQGTRVVLELPQKPMRIRAPLLHGRRQSGKDALANSVRTDDTVRVMLVDDHQLVREGIGNLLKENEHIWVVGTADNGQEAVTKAGELRPDVILMDANMPLMNGIEATRNIRDAYPGIQVVGLSVQNDEAMRESFAQAGATAFLSKAGDLHCLLEPILHCGAAAKTS